jgi:hypothetical protein
MHQLSNTQHKQIAKLAYRLWEERGAPLGSPDDDWFRAEQEFIQRMDSTLQPPFSSVTMDPSSFEARDHALKKRRQSALRSQINFDIAGGPRTTDQHVARSWWLQWIRVIVDSSSDQCALAGMAHPCAARPLYGNVASFCKFQQTGKP